MQCKISFLKQRKKSLEETQDVKNTFSGKTSLVTWKSRITKELYISLTYMYGINILYLFSLVEKQILQYKFR